MQFLRSTLLALVVLVGLVSAQEMPRQPQQEMLNPALPERSALPEQRVTTERVVHQEQRLSEPAMAATQEQQRRLDDVEDEQLVEVDSDEFDVDGYHGGYGGYGYGGKKGFWVPKKKFVEYKKPNKFYAPKKKGGYGGYGYGGYGYGY